MFIADAQTEAYVDRALMGGIFTLSERAGPLGNTLDRVGSSSFTSRQMLDSFSMSLGNIFKGFGGGVFPSGRDLYGSGLSGNFRYFSPRASAVGNFWQAAERNFKEPESFFPLAPPPPIGSGLSFGPNAPAKKK